MLQEDDLGSLSLVSYSREARSEAWRYIQEHAHLSHSDQAPTTVATTGIGSAQYTAEMQETLNIK